VAKPPLVVWFHDGPGQRVLPGFQSDVQALATMGFAVMQFNYRGSAGFGRRHLNAIRDGFDRVPLEDALAAIEYLAQHHAVDPRSVASVGDGFGGYLALRALQLHPGNFRCAVAINALIEPGVDPASERRPPPMPRRMSGRTATSSVEDMNRLAESEGSLGVMEVPGRPTSFEWIEIPAAASTGSPSKDFDLKRELTRKYFDGVRLRRISVPAQMNLLTQPVLLVHDPRSDVAPIAPAQRIRDRLVKKKQTAELIEVSPAFAVPGAPARGPVFRKIGRFLNEQLLGSQVNHGDLIDKE
jgi:pimeloyl-ACP methyl ester carboxylesterase